MNFQIYFGLYFNAAFNKKITKFLRASFFSFFDMTLSNNRRRIEKTL